MLCKSIIFILSITLTTISLAEKNPVVANVNGIKIKLDELNSNYNNAKLYVTDKVVSKDKVLNDLINRYLGITKAKKEKLDKNPVVKSKMEDVLYHAQLSKDLENSFTKISVSDEEVEKYYSQNPEYRSAHILLRVRATPSTEEIKAALNQSMKIYRELKSTPEKFAELAGKYSQSENAETGGDIGYQPKVRLAPEYYRSIHNQPEGFITSPVRSQFGYHVIKNMGKLKYNAVDKNLYRKIVYDIKRDSLIQKYFKNLKKNASIKIEKKYLK
jgi:parvulin-like peptidyl-prolyl isomerase